MRSRRLILPLLAAALVLLVGGASAADTLDVHLVSETNSSITLGWTPVTSGYGYLFSADGQVVSRTYDPTRSTVRFSKGASTYEVAAIVKGATGSYPSVTPPPPPPPVPACSDGKDNDGDGKIDYPADPGCTSASDTDETDPAPPPPPPPSGNTVTLSGTMTNASFQNAILAAPAGALTVTSSSTFTVTGDVSLTRASVTIQHGVFTGVVRLQPTADSNTIQDSTLFGFYVADGGVDSLTLQRNLIDAHCQLAQNWMYGATNFKILNNTIQNFHFCPNESAHSEGIFIAAHNNGGLIQGNTFTDNGTTGHLFFSWWGASNDAASPHTEYPRNICVTGNTFIRSLNGYYHIQFRQEFNGSENIYIDPNTNVKGASIPGYNTALTSLANLFQKPCP